ncbi:MAG: arsenate reductase ArsC [Gammaproteobacteria bacterium]|nr:arsenate reductase ArsC [Gammaproteobacteria bacterium]
MKKVLFVCVENSCRSQMAEALAKMYGNGVIEAYSSGSRPSGVVNEKAIVAMHNIGYDMGAHESKSLDEIPQIEYDYAITMGCGDECPNVRAKNRADWQIPDPKHMQMPQFESVRDSIGDAVIRLVESVKDS